MLIGLDHAIIAVRDLASATRQLERALGLSVTAGGEHPEHGTHNAVARFGLDYLEIIAVRDPARAAASDRGRTVQQFLDSRGDGILGFAIGTDDIDTDLAGAAHRGLSMVGPEAGSRRRPDGSAMTWKLAHVAGDPFGHALPFMIQHDTPPKERVRWAPRDGHPLGARRIPLLSVAVGDLERATESYEALLGGQPEVVEEVPALPARRARFAVGSFHLDLLQPLAADGGLAEFVRSQGDGLFMISLSVPNVDDAVSVLRERGTAVANPTFRRRAPLLDLSQTLGARFQLVEER